MIARTADYKGPQTSQLATRVNNMAARHGTIMRVRSRSGGLENIRRKGELVPNGERYNRWRQEESRPPQCLWCKKEPHNSRPRIAPSKPTELAYDEIVTRVKEHYNPIPVVTVQRYKFNSRVRQPEESVANFVAALRHLASYSLRLRRFPQ